jgi:hypothetical protein
MVFLIMDLLMEWHLNILKVKPVLKNIKMEIKFKDMIKMVKNN